MGIENDIQQQVFRNEHQKAAINLIFTYNWMMEKMKVFLGKEGLTSQQFNILRILRGSDKPMSTLQIRQRMLDKMSDTSRIVDRMVLKGLVQKSGCPKDKRLVDISITPQGKKILSCLDKLENDIDSILGNIDLDDARTLNTILDKIRG